jgi:hypothetical protein
MGTDFEHCKKLQESYKDIPYSETEPDRQWRVHTCFKECKEVNDNKAFIKDNRPVCEEGKNYGLICLDPKDNVCENYTSKDQICFDSDNQICIDWQLLIIAIIVSNVC